MDKLLMDSQDNILVSNDGATLMTHLAIQHPAAILLSQISKSQDEQVGDGTTSVVLLSAALLSQAKNLIMNRNVHASHVIRGFRQCLSIAQHQLLKYSTSTYNNNNNMLISIAKTTMGSKIISAEGDHFVNIAVQCATMLHGKQQQQQQQQQQSMNTTSNDQNKNHQKVHLNNFFVFKISGGSMSQSTILDGCIVKRQLPLTCPQRIDNAIVLVCKMDSLASTKTKFFSSQISVKSHQEASEMNSFERQLLINVCDQIIKCGINVVFNSGSAIHPFAQNYLAQHGVMSVGHVDFKTAQMLSAVTGCIIRTCVQNLTSNNDKFGYAQCVEQVVIAEEKVIQLSGCTNNKEDGPWASVLIRAPSTTLMDECERSIHDTMCTLITALNSQRFIGGGGCMYIHIAQYLRSIMMKQQGVMQLVMDAYAQALEHIPTVLAYNAGLQSSQLIAQMNSKHAQFISLSTTSNVDEKQDVNVIDYPFMALDLRSGTICQNAITDIQVVEPVSVMRQVLCKSMDAAEMIIRIDRNIFLRPEASLSDLGVL